MISIQSGISPYTRSLTNTFRQEFWLFYYPELQNNRDPCPLTPEAKMEFTFHCPNCGQPIMATSDIVGSQAACPHCHCDLIVPSLGQQRKESTTLGMSEAPLCTDITDRQTTASTPNLCPFCLKQIDVFSTVCPHCTKNVGMANLQRREPEAYGAGLICAFLALPLAYFVHKEFIDATFTAASCCFYLAIYPILIFLAYSIAGFWLGFAVTKALRR